MYMVHASTTPPSCQYGSQRHRVCSIHAVSAMQHARTASRQHCWSLVRTFTASHALFRPSPTDQCKPIAPCCIYVYNQGHHLFSLAIHVLFKYHGDVMTTSCLCNKGYALSLNLATYTHGQQECNEFSNKLFMHFGAVIQLMHVFPLSLHTFVP
jgi:hypothetical protein